MGRRETRALGQGGLGDELGEVVAAGVHQEGYYSEEGMSETSAERSSIDPSWGPQRLRIHDGWNLPGLIHHHRGFGGMTESSPCLGLQRPPGGTCHRQ